MRKSLLRRGLSVAVATAVATLGVVAVAAPAQADVSISAANLSTTTVILNGDAGCGNRTKATVKVYDPQNDADELFGVSGTIVAPNGDDVDFLLLKLSSRSGNYSYYTDYAYLCGFDTPGSYKAHITLDWWDDSAGALRTVEKNLPFSVKRPTTLTYNASPEPVKRGSSLTNAGVLQFDPYGYGAYYGKSGVTLKFYFKSSSAKTYAYKGSVVTGKGGKYSKKIKATATGTWKVVYAGDGSHQGQTKYDSVKVK